MQFRKAAVSHFESIDKFDLSSQDFTILANTHAFKQKLFELINSAQRRIYLSALYLQNDDAGQAVLTALYEAKQKNPQLDIKVFVDFHRAQRGLIGKDKCDGNAAFYRQWHQRYQHPISIYGVPIKSKEVLGVLHLKGFIFDNTVLYTGAGINDVYLQQANRYRYDRYHLIRHRQLADSMVKFLNQVFVASKAVQLLTNSEIPTAKQLRRDILQLKRHLLGTQYKIERANQTTDTVPIGCTITPIMGLGGRANLLNKTIYQMLKSCQNTLVLFTPYFNLPPILNREVRRQLKKGRQITIVIGDKTANDFYIPPHEHFSRIGGLPYVYETNLRRFCQQNQKFINQGQLNVQLWSHDDNSFHLKGVNCDNVLHLITGNNLNPRAWRLDLENGLLIQDPEQKLAAAFAEELQTILTHTQRVNNFREIETLNDYPVPVRRLLKTIRRTKIDAVIKNII